MFSPSPVRRPIRFRSPPDRIPFAARSDSVRVTVTFREVLQRDYLIFIVYKKAV